MRKLMLSVACIALLGLVGCGQGSSSGGNATASGGKAQPMAGMAQAEDTLASTASAAVTDAPGGAKAVNAKCFVSGDPVDAQGKKVVYQGKVYGFCCDDCVKAFKDHPEKFVKQ